MYAVVLWKRKLQDLLQCIFSDCGKEPCDAIEESKNSI